MADAAPAGGRGGFRGGFGDRGGRGRGRGRLIHYNINIIQYHLEVDNLTFLFQHQVVDEVVVVVKEERMGKKNGFP